MTFTESHLTNEELDSEVYIKNWNSYRSDRIGREKGGVITYLKENITVSDLFDFSNSYCDSLALFLPKENLAIVTVYRPPQCPTSKFTECLCELDKWITNLNNKEIPPKLILNGDFNLGFLEDWNNNVI